MTKSTWMYKRLRGKNKIDWAESELRYELAKGVHTYHMCECGRKWCRSNMCILCWYEEIAKLKMRLKERDDRRRKISKP